MRVTYFQRCTQPGWYSIERVMDEVRRALPPRVEARVACSRFPSRGVWRRICNVFEAAGRQGDINHVTGDVHYLVLGLRRARTVLTIHDCVQVLHTRGVRRWVLWLFWFWLPARRCARITVVSEFTRQEVSRCARINPRNVTVIPDPLPRGYDPCPRPFRQEAPVFLQVRTTAHKNIERLAEALAGIPCRVRIVGELSPSQQAALARWRIDYSAVRALTDAEMLDEYRRCDAVLMASTYEGFGLPIIEGQAIGRPVIAGQAAAMPEVAGDGACFVDPCRVDSIRAGVLRVIRDADYRAHLIARGFANVERFRPERVAGRYVALYDEILQARGGT